ncbi:Uncharacterized conserved protein (DUF2358) [Seminavis robusta]|uniref:Uncharacterized conserved protein (DUF2358) n=1 Tax=Seminavis robusta TaxID=568900 RepID=A0A9N8DSZ6_9STRA|nr:Uncharacterized conserved protein (DUF2358) [Seminavis robusta]|eukprot:Sro349_g123450.1 Uncharacterized conserved protein (DUF2358) (335) ;mRNA; r:35800-36804
MMISRMMTIRQAIAVGVLLHLVGAAFAFTSGRNPTSLRPLQYLHQWRRQSTSILETWDDRRSIRSTSQSSLLQLGMQRSDKTAAMAPTSVKPALTSSSALQAASLSPLEDWCAHEVEAWYQKAVAVKCPFFKRRFVDLLDGVDMVLKFLVIRHKTLFGPPPGHRSKFSSEDKMRHLTLEQRLAAIGADWKLDTHKGYYITGQLNTTLFRDDCWFDGPDPDMPVQGLRKYLNAASQLFDRRQSQAELLSLEIIDERTILAQWRMNGVLRLPWKPMLPEWTGSTTYHFDEEGLIYRHDEDWDMSVWQAFMKTFAPDMADKIWDEKETLVGETNSLQ